ncbi:hypothetical protein PR048_016677 [Dryococelus australis]|uniref:Uncharacterized protein n=1 Tax=Dryococelus australis TaxID=614101 RepID=A0ABQ9H7H2_9NEOP|nr:hypothetical protein PR048_016677 [Dryococelus australis]
MEEEEEEVAREKASQEVQSVQQLSSASVFESSQMRSTVTTRYGLSASSFSSRFLENVKLLEQQEETSAKSHDVEGVQKEATSEQVESGRLCVSQLSTKRAKTSADTLAVSPPQRSPNSLSPGSPARRELSPQRSAPSYSSRSQDEQQECSSRISSSSSTGMSVATASSEGKQQWLSASSGVYRENAKSMESLRSGGTPQPHHHHRHSFITSSERDMRRVVATSVEARSLESLEREIRMMGKRRAVSGEDVGAAEESLSAAERRRGLYAGVISSDRKATVPQHLSLPPPSAAMHGLATPGADRRLMILSPHSPGDMLHFSSSFATLRTRRKKAVVLPKLILPRSDSDVFLE